MLDEPQIFADGVCEKMLHSVFIMTEMVVLYYSQFCTSENGIKSSTNVKSEKYQTLFQLRFVPFSNHRASVTKLFVEGYSTRKIK